MTSHEIRTGIVAPDEALGPPNHVWLVFSQVLVRVFNGNQAALLKIEDALPRFVHFLFLFLKVVPSFPSLICGHFSMLDLYIPKISGSRKRSENTEIGFVSEIFFP